MLIIGERLNSSRKPVAKAISEKNADFLIKQATLQIESGADFIDVNCAISLEEEKRDLMWLIKILQEALNTSICIDSPSPEVVKAAVDIQKKKPFINSITLEKEKFTNLINILKGKDVFIIGLTVDDNGIPDTFKDRIKLAKRLIPSLKDNAIDVNNIYVDPLVKPISSEPDQAQKFLEAIKELKRQNIKTIGGLSNVSYGLPARRILNAVFLSLAMDAGIDAVIIDPADELIQDIIKDKGKRIKEKLEVFNLAKGALLGQDPYCANYLKAFREGRLIT